MQHFARIEAATRPSLRKKAQPKKPQKMQQAEEDNEQQQQQDDDATPSSQQRNKKFVHHRRAGVITSHVDDNYFPAAEQQQQVPSPREQQQQATTPFKNVMKNISEKIQQQNQQTLNFIKKTSTVPKKLLKNTSMLLKDIIEKQPATPSAEKTIKHDIVNVDDEEMIMIKPKQEDVIGKCIIAGMTLLVLSSFCSSLSCQCRYCTGGIQVCIL